MENDQQNPEFEADMAELLRIGEEGVRRTEELGQKIDALKKERRQKGGPELPIKVA